MLDSEKGVVDGTAVVCVVCHAHPDFSKGGGEVAAYREFLTLRSAGWRVFFVAAVDLPALPAPLIEHAPDEYLYGTAPMAEDRLAWVDIGQRRALVRFLARLPATVFHFHHLWRVGIDVVAELREARPDARFVITMHEMLAICAHHGQMIRPKNRELCTAAAPLRCQACFPHRSLSHFVLRRAVFLGALRHFDAVIYPSAFVQQRFRAWGLRPRQELVLENYLGDSLAAFPRRRRAEPAMATRFGFFGQPTPFKGLDVLVRGFALALTEREDLSLIVFGCERQDLINLFPELAPVLEQAGRAISFYGRYDSSEVLDLMQTVGWVVVPSIWWENSPVVIEEAKRAGAPLIVSDIGGMAEKVHPGTDGLHFKRGSPHDLARVLVEAARPEVFLPLLESLRDSFQREAFLAGLQEVFAGSIEHAANVAA